MEGMKGGEEWWDQLVEGQGAGRDLKDYRSTRGRKLKMKRKKERILML